ncbi:hypothetical protein HYALB_00005823 [Hymenoscyphus albidus]|uniref:CFEM domain-containing protein n=1 Tax=Hymenoscyphus albidus TaxID=595503 RepID=A0A9N9Q040_9HELO|nr:hypothetical protein HYALB_00005823 [Hymenoscyphus albidus]
MKTQSLAAIALASGLQVVAATGFGAPGSFSCPSNTNNECNPQQKPGYSWGDLPTGKFGSYGGMDFNGFKCQNSFGKRDPLAKRTFENSKCITGKATHDKATAPKINCGASSTVPGKQFSVTELHVSVEFDCDLEFHYEMPDKSTCKHTAGCSSAGSIVKNTQCGGATGVVVVYPPQKPGKNTGKTGCDVGIHSIGFDCGPAKSTSVRVSSSTIKPSSSASKPITVPTTLSSATKPLLTPSSSKVESTSKVESSKPAVSTKPAESTKPTHNTKVEETTKPGETSKPVHSTKVEESTQPGETTKPAPSTKVEESTKPGETTKPAPSTKVEESTKPAASGTTVSENSGASSSIKPSIPVVTPSSNVTTPSLAVSSPPAISSPPVLTTSTVYATSVSTIISCGPEVPNCPAHSTALITVTIPISTTICPVSEVVQTPGPSISVAPPGPKPTSVGENSGAPSSVPKPAPSAPAEPIVTVPDVLPKCMNTWNFIVGCVDNTEASCYCPDRDFVNNVYGCLQAHGADAAIIDNAAKYFQGICAPHIPQNPAIVIGAPPAPPAPESPAPVLSNPGPITTQPPSVPVTTIDIVSTITVPCIETTGPLAGYPIPSLTTTTLLSTVLTVPQVVFITLPPPTATGGNPGATAPAPVPVLVVGTPAPAPIPATTTNPIIAPSSIPTGVSGNNGTVKPSAAPSASLTANSGSSMGAAISSVFGAALLAVFAL